MLRGLITTRQPDRDTSRGWCYGSFGLVGQSSLVPIRSGNQLAVTFDYRVLSNI